MNSIMRSPRLNNNNKNIKIHWSPEQRNLKATVIVWENKVVWEGHEKK